MNCYSIRRNKRILHYFVNIFIIDFPVLICYFLLSEFCGTNIINSFVKAYIKICVFLPVWAHILRSSKGSLVQRVDSPVSGGNVRAADKGGVGPAGLSAKLTEGLLPSAGRRYAGRGSEGSAAGGRCSDLSEWQRSVCNEAPPWARRTQGTATGLVCIFTKGEN